MQYQRGVVALLITHPQCLSPMPTNASAAQAPHQPATTARAQRDIVAGHAAHLKRQPCLPQSSGSSCPISSKPCLRRMHPATKQDNHTPEGQAMTST